MAVAKPTQYTVTNISPRRITLDLSEPTKKGIKPKQVRLGAVMDKGLKQDAEPLSTTITAAEYNRIKETGGFKDLITGKSPSLTVQAAA
jgi:hypothetical protein